MTTTNITAFNRTIQKTNEWLNDLMRDLEWDDQEHAYKALRIVLHILRDQLPVKEVTDLSAQLPMLLRGVYFEGWNPNHEAERLHTVDQFVNAVDEQFPEYDSDDVDFYDPYAITRAVFSVISHHVSSGEFEDVTGCLHKGLRELWS